MLLRSVLKKSQPNPVDGGVFDIVDGSKQVVVPIKAHLPVKKAIQFAVTVEILSGVAVCFQAGEDSCVGGC